ncbi:hypothetical protein KEM56_001430, partial [Ascosphaera pollenicola]
LYELAQPKPEEILKESSLVIALDSKTIIKPVVEDINGLSHALIAVDRAKATATDSVALLPIKLYRRGGSAFDRTYHKLSQGGVDRLWASTTQSLFSRRPDENKTLLTFWNLRRLS